MATEERALSSSRRAACQARLLLWLCAAWIAVFAFFHIVPAADTAFSSLFCVEDARTQATCGLFPARRHWLAAIFRDVFYWVPIMALAAVAADMGRQYARDRWADRDRLRDDLLALGAYLLGPILLVNGLLKAYSGRPRPVDTAFFDGDHAFTAVGDFSGACASNCSFVSGEAAAAGWLLCLIPLIRGRFRHIVAAVLIDVSLAAPFLRVVMGSHFLSDALLGWLIGAASLPAGRPLRRVAERHFRNT